MTERFYRAAALMFASNSLKGEYDVERLLSLADEYFQYLTGDNNATIPRPDTPIKGKLPRP
jgi:hypothetical protein